MNLYFRLNIQTKDSNMKRYIYLYICLYTLYTLFFFSPPFSSNPLLIIILFLFVLLFFLNAQTKIQYDAMVYLCINKDLLIFKHE
jgi:succinate-acetate transporter protein